MKKMARSNLNELISVLESIRATEYPDIPPEVIEKIVQAQYDNQDNRGMARTKTMRIISEFMNSVTSDGGDV